ncbi:hypothetical protein RFM26_24615 [Mesorhizobium sp. VK23B]|uniref:Uncharacterized protein n=1 Tax=Mesorhizobium dulcispinae TaxID=3072316 RepID=A0ABU4XKP4_9HYPH|nr:MULTISPECIES: hypothetical protein [unclassified Mesorhizobium]MDX8468896.1 hypothetical protein [Mesorhizobium sp. VK23B]MDX8475315.1 hypothetical protein [Mesorhizobium sp. VK23A]
MVHIIPLSVGQRRRDAGNAGPDASLAGEAVHPLDDHWQAVADHYERRLAQQQAFDTEIAARRLNGEIASAEADTVANAPVDGEGLHHAMYGEVEPFTGRVVQKGRFDTLFDDFLKQAPPELRPGLASRKAALAMQQLQRRNQYEQDQLSAVQAEELENIAKSDPDDTAAFDGSRQAGLDLIAKMNLDPQIRLQTEAAWGAGTAKARMEALIARDPRRAAEMLSAGPVAGKRKASNPATDPLADLSPDDIRRLVSQAHAATATELIEARANIDLASQNAPDAIASTGSYSGAMPSPAAFTAIYGVEEGGKRYQDFSRKIEGGRQAFGMRTMPNQAIHAALRDAEPGPASSKEDQTQYQVTAAAALKTLGMRRADPAGYVREVFPNVDAAWSKVTSPASKSEVSDREAYRQAIAVSVAAQRQLGVDNPQPLPRAVVQSIADGFSKKDVPQADRDTVLSDLLAAAPDRETREALTKQLDQAGVYQSAEIDPITTAATGQQPPPSAPLSEPLSAPQPAGEELGGPAEVGGSNPASPAKKGSLKRPEILFSTRF